METPPTVKPLVQCQKGDQQVKAANGSHGISAQRHILYIIPVMQLQDSRDVRRIALILCTIAIAMLLHAVLGNPAYSFYGQLRAVILIAAVMMLALHWRSGVFLRAVALTGFGLALYHSFAQNSREDWIKWNLATAAVLAGLAIGALKKPRVMKDE